MRKTLFQVWPETKYPLLRCAATLVIVFIAFPVRMALYRDLAEYLVLLFIPAVILCALLFGQTMGILATLLTAANFYSMESGGAFGAELTHPR